MHIKMNRRDLFRNTAAGAAGLTAFGALTPAFAEKTEEGLRGNINHSVARWTYKDLSLDELCELVRSIGFSAIDLVGPDEWPILQKYGVDSSMCNGAEISLEDGWAETSFHPELIERYHKHIDLVSDAGYTNLICFSGNRRAMDPEDGLRNCEAGLNKIIKRAEERNVILHMELLNSKENHPDYLCDTSNWGVELCKRLGSPNFKLLYDIYHMQIMEGDIIRTIQENHEYFGHYHTAGVPGRHEIDDSQELYYPAICRAIKDTGFKGYLAQEFTADRETAGEAAESLRAAIHICDV